MVRRRKNTEVLLTGDKVDPRERFITKTNDAPPPARAEILIPDADGKYRKSEVGGIDHSTISQSPPTLPADDPPEKEDDAALSLAERARKKPKVIDARQEPGKAETWEIEQIGGGQARDGAAWAPDEAGTSRGELDMMAPDAGSAPAAPEATDIPKRSAPAAPEVIEAPTPKKSHPKPAPKKVPRPPTAKEQSKVLAETVVTSMVDRMREEALKKGSLTAEDIDAMKGEFDKQAAALTETFEQSFEDYVKARERADWDQKRDYPFDRIIVKRFSPLFNETDMSRFDRVSRRMLPGFFMALSMMLGPEEVDEYQEKARMIVGRLREDLGDGFDWEDVYADRDGRMLTLDALVGIAVQFDDFERRSEWIIELINGHLTPATDSDRADAGWEMGPAAVKNFLGSLLADLRRALESKSGKARITKRHGANVIRTINNVFRQIDA